MVVGVEGVWQLGWRGGGCVAVELRVVDSTAGEH